ncbi:MAG: DUF1501 domain-containing protein [Acidimicrobiia bacterium]|nr:DUF1501 domain-containing protein [Acidimicrobiia bacterium]
MDFREFQQIQTRRSFLGRCSAGLGSVALWHLLADEGRARAGESPASRERPLDPRHPHFRPKAKNVIFLFMDGGPSHIDLFDPKPEMKKWDGQALPDSMVKDLKLAFIKPTAKVWPSPRRFKPSGQSGIELSEWLPHLASVADDICLIRSMFTDQFNHHPGQLMLNCGSPLVGRPSMGAWVTYGLGSTSKDLPGFVVLRSGGNAPGAGTGNWTNGFLPSSYQGVPLRSSGDAVLYLSDPPGVSRELQRSTLDGLRDLNELSQAESGDVEIASRIAAYELAFRMQLAAPELMDLSKESPATMAMYGIEKSHPNPFAANCLLARRMVERGVRFVQLMHGSWDDHDDLERKLKRNCEATDQATAALLKDLKQRGLLDSTLVVWGGEFGRTPMVQADSPNKKVGFGRDHHPFAFSMWLAGGGIKGGQAIGRTDELGLRVIENQVHVHDLHATILHCLGLDHHRLTYRFAGRDFRLTDVAGDVVRKALA